MADNQRVGRGGEIALAIIAGIIGIIAGLFAVGVGGIQQTGAGSDTGMNVGGLGWAAIGFSVLGIVSAFFVSSRSKLAGWLLVISAIGGLISVSIFFLLPFLLFLIAGLMCLLRGRKPKPA